MSDSPPPHASGPGASGPTPRAQDARDARVLTWVGVAGIAITLAVVTISVVFRPVPTRVPERRLVDFELIDRTGRPVTRADVQDRFLVVSFVFTSCSLTCLEVHRNMAHNLRTVVLGPMGRIHSQFDGNRWTSQELAAAMREAAGTEE